MFFYVITRFYFLIFCLKLVLSFLMLEIKQTMQKAGLVVQVSSIRAQVKKESVCLVEAEFASWEEYGGAACHSGEKIHVAEAQL